MLARAGHDVGFVARGAHGEAIRGKGLTIRRFDGEFTVNAAATPNPVELGPADLVLLAVKNYDNDTALPLLRPLVGSRHDRAHAAERRRQPGRGSGRRGPRRGARRRRLHRDGHRRARRHRADRQLPADRVRRGVRPRSPDFGSRRANREGPRRCRHRSAAGRGRTRAVVGEVHLSRGDVRDDRRCAPAARRRAWRSGDPPPAVRRHSRGRGRGTRGRRARRPGHRRSALGVRRRGAGVDAIVAADRSVAGRRIEVEALQGSVVRRAARLGVPVPIMETLYAVLRAAAAAPSQ